MSKEIKNDLKNKTIKNLYLFYGEEKYLRSYYENAVLEAVAGEEAVRGLNLNVFERGVKADAIIDAAETMPFMSERRLVLVKDSGFFDTGKKDESEKLAAYFPNIPDSTCILFNEDSIDKRGKIYKAVSKAGSAVEFKHQTENELLAWIKKICKRDNKAITDKSGLLLIRYCGGSMDSLFMELQKLIAYAAEKEEITEGDINLLVTKSLESKIFELVAAIGNKNVDTALTMYHDMLVLKEPPIVILSMITRQFRMIFQTKTLLEKGLSSTEIAARLGLRGFIVSDCVRQSHNFKINVLRKALDDCLDTDTGIKSGKIEAKLGVELLIVEYAGEPAAK